MSLIDDFMNTGMDEVDSLIGTVVMECNGQSFPVVFDNSRKSFEGAMGGLESDIQAQVTAQPRNVANPHAMLKTRCVVNGEPYRVAEVAVGNIAVIFTLTSTNNTR